MRPDQGTGVFGADIFGGSLDEGVERFSTTSKADALLEHDGEEEVLVKVILKVGMANVPPYVLSKSEQLGTIYVCGDLPAMPGTQSEGGMWVRARRIMLTSFWKVQRSSTSAGRTYTLTLNAPPSEREAGYAQGYEIGQRGH